MKGLFLFFAALNVAFFIWQFSASGSSNSAAQLNALPPNVKRLVLLNDGKKPPKEKPAKKPKQEKKTQAAKKIKTASSRTSGKAEICYSLGPFETTKQARPISAKLRDLGAKTKIESQKRRVSSGYWVYITKFSTWADARKKVMELEDLGMTDIFIMGRGRMKNAVSLGLYKDKSAADARVGELKRMRVKASVETQFTLAEEQWIDINVRGSNKKVINSIQTIARGLTVLKLKDRTCK